MEARGGDQGEREVVQAHTHTKKEREGGEREEKENILSAGQCLQVGPKLRAVLKLVH